MVNSTCLVLLSGGQDSTTCLYWAKKEFKEVRAVTFAYGQRHSIECSQAFGIAERAKVKLESLSLGTIFHDIGNSALVTTDRNISDSHENDKNLPASFVPGRNIILLSFAAAYAYKLKIHDIVCGVNSEDFSGYYDCRRSTINNLQHTLSLGLGFHINIYTPLVSLSKADIVKLAVELGCIDEMKHTVSCYEGKIPPCGKCPACVLRAKGFKEAEVEDPLLRGKNNE